MNSHVRSSISIIFQNATKLPPLTRETFQRLPKGRDVNAGPLIVLTNINIIMIRHSLMVVSMLQRIIVVHQTMILYLGATHKTVKHAGNTVMCPDVQVLYDFLVTVKAAPHECVIRTGQP